MSIFKNLIEADLKLIERNSDLEEKARKDSLTNTWNHSHIINILSNEIKRSARYGTNLSISMLDIDDFKKINDSCGHYVGDIFLKEITNCLKEQLREIDYIGRYGGEEFLIILPNTDLQGAYMQAERIRKKISDIRIASSKVTISFGLATYQKGDTLSGLINRADYLMYEAKKKGKNSIAVDAATTS